jgi:transposase
VELQRKREVVLRSLRGESLDAISREVGVPIARLERWRDGALAGIDAGLRERGSDARDEELESVKAKLGEALMENELLRVKASCIGPFGIKRWKR